MLHKFTSHSLCDLFEALATIQLFSFAKHCRLKVPLHHNPTLLHIQMHYIVSDNTIKRRIPMFQHNLVLLIKYVCLSQAFNPQMHDFHYNTGFLKTFLHQNDACMWCWRWSRLIISRLQCQHHMHASCCLHDQCWPIMSQHSVVELGSAALFTM